MRVRLLFLAFLYFPGTVIHELSHFFMAKLLRVPVGGLSLIPKFHENSLELGHVLIGKTDFIRRFFVGVAPLFSGIAILYFLFYVVRSSEITVIGALLIIYLTFAVLNTMSLSRSDLKGSWKVLLILLLAIAFLIAIH